MNYLSISDNVGTSVEVQSTRIPWRWQFTVRDLKEGGTVYTRRGFWGSANLAVEILADTWNELDTGFAIKVSA